MGLLASLFGSMEEGGLEHPAAVPKGMRAYAVGDVHGRADLLLPLLEAIKADAKGWQGKVVLVMMGDVVDRGPQSADVVDMLQLAVPQTWESLTLRGNHEQAMLDFLSTPKRAAAWLAWGGTQTLESYGIKPYGAKGHRPPEALADELDMVLEARGHKAFYAQTRLSHTLGDVLFVHAGVRPGVPLERQQENDFLYIREDFMGRPHHLPYRVVFGHTILPQVLVEGDRIGLDTGAYQSGQLSAVALEGESVRIATATAEGVMWKEAEPAAKK